jgi:hypothetical protein
LSQNQQFGLAKSRFEELAAGVDAEEGQALAVGGLVVLDEIAVAIARLEVAVAISQRRWRLFRAHCLTASICSREQLGERRKTIFWLPASRAAGGSGRGQGRLAADACFL